MMRICRLWSLLLLLCMTLAALAGCSVKSGTDESAPASTEPAATTAAITTEEPAMTVDGYVSMSECKSYVKPIGRTRFLKNGFIVDWSASGIEFEYEGSGDLRVEIEKDNENGSTHNAVLIAEVDGVKHTLTVTESDTYRVASNLPEGTHRVLIRRRTMVEDGAVGILVSIKGIRMTGRFLPKPADNKYNVAFVGDSITCGVGLTSSDGLATYAVDLCTREGFDYDICSVSGIGVSHSTSKHKGTENTMTKYYPYFNYYRSKTLRYMPERKADLVIVNLNTNDHNTGATEARYKEDLKTLISEIRAAHGANVKIVWVVGMMISPDAAVNGWLNAVFAELGGESAGLYKIKVETNTKGEHGHPNQASHLAVSQALSAFIREKGLLDLPTRQ